MWKTRLQQVYVRTATNPLRFVYVQDVFCNVLQVNTARLEQQRPENDREMRHEVSTNAYTSQHLNLFSTAKHIHLKFQQFGPKHVGG